MWFPALLLVQIWVTNGDELGQGHPNLGPHTRLGWSRDGQAPRVGDGPVGLKQVTSFAGPQLGHHPETGMMSFDTSQAPPGSTREGEAVVDGPAG